MLLAFIDQHVMQLVQRVHAIGNGRLRSQIRVALRQPVVPVQQRAGDLTKPLLDRV